MHHLASACIEFLLRQRQSKRGWTSICDVPVIFMPTPSSCERLKTPLIFFSGRRPYTHNNSVLEHWHWNETYQWFWACAMMLLDLSLAQTPLNLSLRANQAEKRWLRRRWWFSQSSFELQSTDLGSNSWISLNLIAPTVSMVPTRKHFVLFCMGIFPFACKIPAFQKLGGQGPSTVCKLLSSFAFLSMPHSCKKTDRESDFENREE